MCLTELVKDLSKKFGFTLKNNLSRRMNRSFCFFSGTMFTWQERLVFLSVTCHKSCRLKFGAGPTHLCHFSFIAGSHCFFDILISLRCTTFFFSKFIPWHAAHNFFLYRPYLPLLRTIATYMALWWRFVAHNDDDGATPATIVLLLLNFTVPALFSTSSSSQLKFHSTFFQSASVDSLPRSRSHRQFCCLARGARRHKIYIFPCSCYRLFIHFVKLFLLCIIHFLLCESGCGSSYCYFCHVFGWILMLMLIIK